MLLPAPCHVTSPSPRYGKASLHGSYGDVDGCFEFKDSSVHFPMQSGELLTMAGRGKRFSVVSTVIPTNLNVYASTFWCY